MPHPHTIFMLLRTTPAWLGLSRPERRSFMDRVVRPVLERYPDVKTRYFDAESFHARCTDLAMWETTNLQHYTFVVDALRDTAFFGLPYFEIVDIITTQEEGYLRYDQHLAVQS